MQLGISESETFLLFQWSFHTWSFQTVAFSLKKVTKHNSVWTDSCILLWAHLSFFFFFGIFTLNDNSLITAHNAINQVTISRWTAANALSNRIHLSTLFSVSKKFCEDSIWQKCLIGVFRVSTILMHVHPTVISTGHVCSLGSAPGSIVRPLIFFWRIPYFKCRTHLAVLAPSWFWK